MPTPAKLNPVTIRMPHDVQVRLARRCSKENRTRSNLVLRYVEQGLSRDEKKQPQAPQADARELD